MELFIRVLSRYQPHSIIFRKTAVDFERGDFTNTCNIEMPQETPYVKLKINELDDKLLQQGPCVTSCRETWDI